MWTKGRNFIRDEESKNNGKDIGKRKDVKKEVDQSIKVEKVTRKVRKEKDK